MLDAGEVLVVRMSLGIILADDKVSVCGTGGEELSNTGLVLGTVSEMRMQKSCRINEEWHAH